MSVDQGMAITGEIISWLGGGLVVVGSIIGAAWLLFRFFAQKWMENRFNERLEAFKQAGSVEIARVKFAIDAKMDRALKLHEKEFDTLTTAWDKLTSMIGSAAAVVAPLQSYHPVGGMTLEELDAVLAKTDFEEHEKGKLRQSAGQKRDKLYQDWCDRDRINRAMTDRQAFHNYIIQRGIFIQPELKDRMMELSLLISDAIITQSQITQPDYPMPRPYAENTAKVRGKGTDLMNEIGREISARIWDARSLDD